MLVLDDYDVIRVPPDRLAIGTASYSRGDDGNKFLASLQENGFKIRKKNGEEIFLKAIGAQFLYSIADAESLMIEIDGGLDEESLR